MDRCDRSSSATCARYARAPLAVWHSTGSPHVTNVVASVTQAEETGGSLGDVLSDQARQRRQERFLRAEKLANQAPVKMLFPLIALLFPITFIIIGFPIVVQLIDAGAFDLF